MVLAAGVGSGVYRFFLLLHILSAVVGFGGVMLNGVYAAQAKRRGGAEGAAVSEANYEVSKIAEYAIYAVFVFGVITVSLGKDDVKFSQSWVGISMVLYLIAAVVARLVLIPGHRQLNELMRAGASRTELASREKRLAAVGGTLNLVFVVILFLMVFKPGGPRI
ncbi:MAG: hypothetical protein QOG64_2190 [Acidimicrobiaceae bacterium]|jgi:uncharacterized membrane protein|nr:hypothetical protein [Acidimicrobiaceae bacterium]